MVDDCRRTILICIHKFENKRYTLRDRLSKRKRSALRVTIGSAWGYILKEMGSAVKAMDNRPAWQKALAAYHRLGQDLRLGGYPRPFVNVPTAALPVRTLNFTVPYKQCHWAGCIDAMMKPAHPLKACKGCFEVFYCGRFCQHE